MVQLLVSNLELSVKEALQRHGRSMEEKARLILWQAAEAEQHEPQGVGLGSQMAALYAGIGVEEPIPEWQGHKAAPVAF